MGYRQAAAEGGEGERILGPRDRGGWVPQELEGIGHGGEQVGPRLEAAAIDQTLDRPAAGQAMQRRDQGPAVEASLHAAGDTSNLLAEVAGIEIGKEIGDQRTVGRAQRCLRQGAPRQRRDQDRRPIIWRSCGQDRMHP